MTNKPTKINQFECSNILLVLTLLIHSQQIIAGPLGLPNSARPGAVRPQIEVQAEKAVAPSSDTVKIPALIDRPFVSVKQLRLLDAEELPKYEISVEEINTEILDKSLQDQPERGFSIGELQEIADEVTRYYRSKGLILSTAVIPVQTVDLGRRYSNIYWTARTRHCRE